MASRAWSRALSIAMFALAVSVLSRGQADEPKVDGDLKAIQGEWTSKDDQGESFWNFKGNHVSLKTPSRAYEIAIRLDPKGEPQKHIDFHVADNSPDAKGYKAKGIYKLEGDGALKIAFAGEDNRPEEFTTDFSKQQFAFELKRKK